jgi:hypothetical protein
VKKRRGIYFLANDRVYDLTIAFLNSLRRNNPSIGLCFIPYNSDSQRIRALCDTYEFSIFDDDDVLRWCDAISLRFHDHVVGQYRKLAAWAGHFDEFIYIDVDTIILANVEFCFDFLSEFDFVASHSNIETIRKWVWKDTIFNTGQLTDEQINFAANTGFLVSKKNALSHALVTDAVETAAKLSGHMELYCVEQPLLNYLIVTAGRPYTSLFVLKYQRGLNIPLEVWAGTPGGVVERGKIRFEGSSEPLLVHWAGQWQPTKPGETRRQEIPYQSLWEYYRSLREGV